MSVAELWDRYSKKVYPNGMGVEQESQLRKAFFAAAYSLSNALCEMRDRFVSDDVAAKFMQNFVEEMAEYSAKVLEDQARRAAGN